jgi:hypothetical protein
MKKLNLLAFSFFFLTNIYAGFDHTHQAFDQLLKKHVTFKGYQSLVDYKGLKKSTLDKYLDTLKNVTSKQFEGWDKNNQLAFLINSYNAFTLKLIVQNYPVKSIKDLGGFLSSPWRKKFFKLFGKKTHLDHIEHELIRKNFDEPRIHFAVVCASIGCPPMQNFAFQGLLLEAQLEKAIVPFLLDINKNKLDPAKKTLYVSKIFKWYGSDFDKKFGHYLNFLAPRLTQDPTQLKELKSKKWDIEYTDYSWKLNEWIK